MTIENQPQSPPISGRKTTRRTFLRNAAIGAAPLILPRSLWAGNHTPSERVTMGLIGMGNNPMVGASVAVSVAVEQAMGK